uniref:outer membrane protein n=1 Tax=Novosphingobium sp. B 225 TaxID=1961849 RepID=UPI001124E356
MRKLVIGMALATTAMATPALARDDSWYVEGDAGGTIVEDIQNMTGVNNLGILETKAGYDVGGIVGYDFGAFRLETEASYRRAHIKAYRSPTLNYTYSPMVGGASALSFMINGLIDFGPDDGLQGYVGAGAGVGRVKNQMFIPTTALQVNDSDTGFAWQGLAGVRMPVSSNVDLGLKYRFYNQFNNDLVNAAGKSIRTRFRSHSLMLTLGYNFGAAPEPVA